MFSIVADESVDFGIVQSLRKENINVISIQESYGGIADEEVLQVALKNDAILITEDKDFGELVFRLGMKHTGVLLIRILDVDRSIKIEYATATISKNLAALQNKFSVLTENKLRIK
jgi:predicted nuclease of predicted toxin-antitoxin system